MENQYIYLLQEREFIKSNEPIYKLGKTRQECLKRISNYPNGTKLIFQILCNDCDNYEKELIHIFKNTFIQKKEIGNEYFKGNLYKMIEIIYNLIHDKYIKPNIDFDNVNNDNDNTIKCSKCNKQLLSNCYLKKHLLICKGVSNPLECHLCHKIYASYSSKSKHLKICKEKSKQLIEPEEQDEKIQEIQIINNNLVRFNEEEVKIDFDIKHLESNIVHKLYIIAPEDAFRLFYKKLFENKNNQMIIKPNLKHTYSDVHIGENIWHKMLDDYIYHIIMHFIGESLISYIYNNTINNEDNQLKEYVNSMTTKGYSNKNTKEIEKSYKNHIKSLKCLFNTFKKKYIY